MKKIILLIAFLFSVTIYGQTPFPTGARFMNATKSDTLSGQTRIPILKAENGNLLNYYTEIDSLKYALNINDENAIHDNEAGEINAITEKVTPVGADVLLMEDSEDGFEKKSVEISNLPFTNFSWDYDYNDLINTPDFSDFSFTPPYLNELVPDTYLPSTTGNFILRGSFFTPDMDITIEGHTINYQTFVNSNEFIVNLTTSATEGFYDVTLDNGLISVYPDQLQVVNGTVYEPVNSEWINTSGNITLDNDDLRILVDGSLGSTEWNRTFDITKDFEIYFTREFSPIAANGSFHSVDLVTFTDLTTSDYYTIRSVYNSGGGGRFYVLKNGVSLYNIIYGLNTDTNVVKLSFNESTNVMSFYIDNVLRYSFANTEFQNDFNSTWNVQWYYDITNIKYIDLSDTGGGYIDPDKLISQFTNDIGYLEDAPSDGEEYVRKDGDWEIATGGSGTGDMEASTYDPTNVAGDAFDMDNMVEGTDTKILTASERTAIATNTSHVSNTSNPHSVTASQLGSGVLGPGVFAYFYSNNNNSYYKVPFIDTNSSASGNYLLQHDTSLFLTYNPFLGILTSQNFITSADPYDSGWNGDDTVPTKNDVYDEMELKISSDGTGRTNAEEVSNQYAQSRADYATDGAPSAGTWVFIKDPLNGEEIAAGSTTIDFVDANGYATPYIFLDNTTDDETSFTLTDMRELDVVEIYLNQATEPSFTPTVDIVPDTLDWTADSLASTDVTLTVWRDGLGNYQGVYTKRP